MFVAQARTTPGLHILGICAGTGTKYLPSYHDSTPATVWDHYGVTSDQAVRRGMNPKMFNSFLDGSKSAIEMAAVANAAGLETILTPQSEGGILHGKGTVEVVSSHNRDGSQIQGHLRWGVYVTFEATNDYAAHCRPD